MREKKPKTLCTVVCTTHYARHIHFLITCYKHWDKLTEMAEQMAEQILTIQDAAEKSDRDSDSESVCGRPSARQTSEATCLTTANDVQHYSVMSCRKASQNSAHLYCVLLF